MTTAPARNLQALEAFLDHLPTALLLIEPGTGAVFFANRAAHDLAGGEFPMGGGAEEYERLYRCFDASGRRIPPEEMPGVVVARGTPLSNFQMDWDTPRGLRSILVNGGIVEAPDGLPVAVVTFDDVTEIEASRRRSEVLSEVGATLATSLDLLETMRAVSRLCVPRFADWCFVEMLQPDGSITRPVINAADPAKLAHAGDFDTRWPLDPDAPHGSPKVIRTGEPELVTEVPPGFAEMAAQDDEHRALLEAIGFTSFMIVPLRAGGRIIGDLALAMAESGRRYTEDDLAAGQELADRCAMFMESARLYTELRETEAAEREAREELQTILAGVADIITAQDTTGRLVYANQAAADQMGFDTPEELLAAPIKEIFGRFVMLDEDGRPLDLERFPGRQALRGEEPQPLIVRYRPAAGGEDRISRVKARPVFDERGEVRLAINVVEDISDMRRSEATQRFLAEASQVLAASLDYEQTLHSVADLAVPAVADWCVVDLKTADGFERVATAHWDPAKIELAKSYSERWPPPQDAPQGVAAVIRGGAPELYSEITDEILVAAARDEEHLRVVRELGMSSVMIVPMRVRDEVLGAITLIAAESGRRFDAEDLARAEQLGQRAAAAVDAARLYRQRSQIAKTLQASLLPPELPAIEGLQTAAIYQPAGEGNDVGGDFYDVFSVAEDQWFVVIGDVCGKGAEAAAVTALARYTIRAAAVRRRSPTHVLRWLNDVMQRETAADARFVTIAILRLDLGAELGATRVTAASGGHPLPRILRADGTVQRLGVPGTLIGVVPDVEIEDHVSELNAGDSIVVFTDGLSEAGAPERVWSPEDVDAAMERASAGGTASPAELIDRLMADALPEGRTSRDDVAVLALRADAV